ncbi:hypothetical protein [Alteromonas flava]|uniref:hypothetical protein n=1 Tax=Alteromonas flava TaxID=2048003 RepID=UPI000C282EA3|nr:hypothetical protein [Alteromonas flava]
MKLFNKTALAVAVAAMSATSAVAGDLDFGNSDRTVVLADVIFGNGNPGQGSEETLITAPTVDFTLPAVGALPAVQGDNGALNAVATIKYTLGRGAVFGEDLSTTTLVEQSNGGLGALTLIGVDELDAAINDSQNLGLGLTYEVVQGGAIGDNTITFEISFAADDVELSSLRFEGYAVKNLKDALNPSSTDKTVKLGVEYVEATDFAADVVDATETDTPLTIFASQAPVDLVAVIEDVAGNGIRINVGNGETSFTNAGINDFDPAGDVDTVFLGTLQLQLQDIVGFGYNAAATPATTGEKIAKENGDDFDFQGGDDHTLTFSVNSGSLQEDSIVELRALNAGACTGAVFSSNTISAAEINSFELAVSGTTTELTSGYELCYTVDGTSVIPEAGDINATWEIDFFNARYDNIEEDAGPFGELLRNGCIASFFNVPAVGNADTAYIRLTNTSSTNEGDIRGTLYAQDGTVLGEDVTIAPDLATSATQVFSTEGANRTTAAGQDIIDIETAFGVDGSTDYKGRARLVLKGAFDTCEGLGLIRTGEGSLFNMTATTQGNEAGGSNDGNNGN